MPEENVFNRITREYYQLTASEKKLANFVVANGQRSQSMSISELAAACGVAEATISRFCRRMGYRGYSALRSGSTRSSTPVTFRRIMGMPKARPVRVSGMVLGPRPVGSAIPWFRSQSRS